MPDVALPGWLAALIVAGIAAGAITGIVSLAVKTGRGVKTLSSWMTDRFREAVEQTVAPDLRRIENQLTSSNGGSMREQVNGIRQDLTEHIRISAKDREELRVWLEHVDPDGPPDDGR